MHDALAATGSHDDELSLFNCFSPRDLPEHSMTVQWWSESNGERGSTSWRKTPETERSPPVAKKSLEIKTVVYGNGMISRTGNAGTMSLSGRRILIQVVVQAEIGICWGNFCSHPAQPANRSIKLLHNTRPVVEIKMTWKFGFFFIKAQWFTIYFKGPFEMLQPSLFAWFTGSVGG